MKAFLCVLLLALALRTEAGIVYHEVSKTLNDPLHRSPSAARVSIDGNRYRIDFEPSDSVRTHDVVISRDGDRSATMINLQNRTWYERSEMQEGVTSRFFDAAHKRGASLNIVEEPSGETIAGHSSKKYVLRLAFKGEPQITATVLVWTAVDLPPAPMRPPLRVGDEELDARIASAYSAFDGLILKQTLSVTRLYSGGKPSVEVHTNVVDEIRVEDVPSSAFELPSGLVHQPPQIGVPGVSR